MLNCPCSYLLDLFPRVFKLGILYNDLSQQRAHLGTTEDIDEECLVEVGLPYFATPCPC